MELFLFSIWSKCRQFRLSKCRHFHFIKMSTFVLSKCRHFNKNGKKLNWCKVTTLLRPWKPETNKLSSILESTKNKSESQHANSQQLLWNHPHDLLDSWLVSTDHVVTARVISYKPWFVVVKSKTSTKEKMGKAKRSTHGKTANAKALAKRRASKAPAPKKRDEIDKDVSNLNTKQRSSVKWLNLMELSLRIILVY